MDQLTEAIFQTVEKLDVNGNLTSEMVSQVTEDLSEFVEFAARKYIKGQSEHGGHISERDLNIEIDQEIVDLFFYHSANKRKQA